MLHHKTEKRDSLAEDLICFFILENIKTVEKAV